MRKKHMMVRYTPLATSETGSITTHACPSRTKLVCAALVIIVFLFILVTTVIRTQTLTFNPGYPGKSAYVLGMLSKSGTSNKTLQQISDHCTQGDNKNQDDKEHLVQKLPIAIIVGARKAGTRALLRFISLHSDVAVAGREVHFFDRLSNYEKGLQWYCEQMPFSYQNQITVEKTPNYFVDWKVPERIYKYNSSIKLMLIVRNPIERAMSDYLQIKVKKKQRGLSDMTPEFEDLAIDKHTGKVDRSYGAIKRSLYVRHLDRWLQYFPLSQIFISDGEKMRKKPWEEMKKVESFLGLSHQISKNMFVFNASKGFYCLKSWPKMIYMKDVEEEDKSLVDTVMESERCLAPSKGREHPVIDKHVRQKLKLFFKPFNEKLFNRINRRFDWR